MTSEPADPKYLTPSEAAKMLGVSARTIDRWAQQGRIPCVVTLGGHRRFRLEHVLAVGEEMAGIGTQGADPGPPATSVRSSERSRTPGSRRKRS